MNRSILSILGSAGVAAGLAVLLAAASRPAADRRPNRAPRAAPAHVAARSVVLPALVGAVSNPGAPPAAREHATIARIRSRAARADSRATPAQHPELDWTYSGYATLNGVPWALVQRKGEPGRVVRPGDSMDGYTVKRISPQAVELRRNRETIALSRGPGYDLAPAVTASVPPQPAPPAGDQQTAADLQPAATQSQADLAQLQAAAQAQIQAVQAQADLARQQQAAAEALQAAQYAAQEAEMERVAQQQEYAAALQAAMAAQQARAIMGPAPFTGSYLPYVANGYPMYR